jgi:hypothetical protein
MCLGALLATGCSGVVADDSLEGEESSELTVPGKVKVGGHVVDVETDYIPRVVQCENPDAPYESLKAQAVSARTYLTYRSDRKVLPTITDGQSDQVYTCASNHYGSYVAADVRRAVEETRGEVVLWNGKITAGFFVAGSRRTAETCRATSDPTNTERFVTYNFGLVEGTSDGSKIGVRGDDVNRGCMAQNLANCLAVTASYDYGMLSRYFYGSDVQVATIGTTSLTAADIAEVAADDHAEVLCWSPTLGRGVPKGTCVQAISNRNWYQCTDDGSFQLSTVNDGPVGACKSSLPL